VNLKTRQQGISAISQLFVIIIILSVFLLALKIIPIYLNNYKVASSLKALQNTPGLLSLSATEIRSKLDKYFDMNYVEHVTAQDIKIVKQYDYVKVDINYERVEPIVGNLSVLVEFNEGFQSGK
jgi:capsule polysaccharide export protein KpsE/RkpR